jgi:hypothetical protein
VGRLVGLDLARGLAVFGMYAVHVGPAPGQDGVVGFLMELAQGRSSALFAVLAGFAVALITGRRTPKEGLAGRQAVAKVIIRAVILWAHWPLKKTLPTATMRSPAQTAYCRQFVPPTNDAAISIMSGAVNPKVVIMTVAHSSACWTSMTPTRPWVQGGKAGGGHRFDVAAELCGPAALGEAQFRGGGGPVHVPLPGFDGRVLHLADLLHLAHRLRG